MFKAFENASEDMLKELEKKIGFSLPEDYKEFVLKTNGGAFDDLDHGFGLDFEDGSSEEISMNVLYGINENHTFDIYYHVNEYRLDLPKKTILIGHTHSGDGIIFVVEGEDQGLYLWDSSLYFKESTPEECVYYLAEDFTEFLELIEFEN